MAKTGLSAVEGERTCHTAPQRNDFDGNSGEPSSSTGNVDRSPEVEKLATDGGVGFEGDAVEFESEVFGGAVSGQVKESGFEVEVVTTLDFDVGVPGVIFFSGPSATTATVADGITADFEWRMADIVN